MRIPGTNIVIGTKKIKDQDPWVRGHVTLSEVTRRIWSRPCDYDELVRAFDNVPSVQTTVDLCAQTIATTPLRGYERVNSKPTHAGRKIKAYLRTKSYDARAQSAARSEYEVREVTDPDHPACALLSHWNDIHDEYSGKFTVARWVKLCGGGFIQMVGDIAGGTGSLMPMATHRTWQIPNEKRVEPLILGYRYGDTKLDADEMYDVSDIIRIGVPGISDPMLFHSCYQSAIHDIRKLFSFTIFQRAMLESGGSPGAVVKGFLSEDQAEVFKAQYRAAFSGETNADRLMTLEKGLEFTRLDVSKELAFLESDKAAEARVYKAANVPATLMEQENANLAGAARANPQFVELCVRPVMLQMEGAFNTYLAPKFGPNILFAFDPVNAEEVEDTQIAVSLYTGDILNRNEARSRVGEDPVPGGDVYYSDAMKPDPWAGLSLGLPKDRSDPADSLDTNTDKPKTGTPPSVDVVADQALNGAQVDALRTMATDVASGLIPRVAAEEIARAAFPAVLPERIERIFNSAERDRAKANPNVDQPNTDEQATKLYTDHAFGLCGCRSCRGTKSAEEDLEPAGELASPLSIELRKAFERIYAASVPVAAQEGLSASLAQRIEAIVADEAGLMKETMRPYLTESLQTGYVAGGSELPAELGSFEVLSDAASEALDRRMDGLIADIGETTGKQVGQIMKRAIDNGATPKEAAAMLREEIPGITDRRAKLIANTETSKALLDGREQAWIDSGGVEGKSWLLSSAPCPVCQAIAAKWEGRACPLGEPFVNAGEVLGGMTFNRDIYNTAHPDCDCSTGAVIGGA